MRARKPSTATPTETANAAGRSALNTEPLNRRRRVATAHWITTTMTESPHPNAWRGSRPDMASYDAITGEQVSFIYLPSGERIAVGGGGDPVEQARAIIAAHNATLSAPPLDREEVARIIDPLPFDSGPTGWVAMPGDRAFRQNAARVKADAILSLSRPEERLTGWRLVPVRPTVDMVAAFWRIKNTGSTEVGETGEDRSDYAAYAAMLRAAPPPPTSPDDQGAEVGR